MPFSSTIYKTHLCVTKSGCITHERGIGCRHFTAVSDKFKNTDTISQNYIGQMEKNMRNIIIRIIVNMIAFWVASTLIGRISLSNNLVEWIGVAIVFGLVNAFIKPIIKLLTLPINLATLGLFTIVINAFLLLLTSWIVPGLSFESGVFGNIVSALVASIVISIVSMILNWFIKD